MKGVWPSRNVFFYFLKEFLLTLCPINRSLLLTIVFVDGYANVILHTDDSWATSNLQVSLRSPYFGNFIFLMVILVWIWATAPACKLVSSRLLPSPLVHWAASGVFHRLGEGCCPPSAKPPRPPLSAESSRSSSKKPLSRTLRNFASASVFLARCHGSVLEARTHAWCQASCPRVLVLGGGEAGREGTAGAGAE